MLSQIWHFTLGKTFYEVFFCWRPDLWSLSWRAPYGMTTDIIYRLGPLRVIIARL